MELETQIEKCINDLLTLKDSNEVIKGIMEITGELNSKQMNAWSGDQLSRAGAKLSILLINLGQYSAECKMRHDSVKNYKRIQIEKLYMASQGTQGDRRSKANMNAEVTAEKEVYAKYVKDAIESLYEDVKNLVTMFQSRLKMLISEDFATRNKELTDE